MEPITLIVNEEPTVISPTVDTPPIIIEAGVPGPPGVGIPGPAGAQALSLTAATDLGGHRIVTTDTDGNAIYADSADMTHVGRIVGITTGAAAAGTSALVLTGGEIDDPSFSFIPGDTLYLGTSGQIVTAAPSNGIYQPLGYAETATRIFIRIGLSVLR